MNLIISSITLILVNLFTLIGVIFLKWNASEIIAIFWIENLIIGIFNVLKMLLSKVVKKEDLFLKIFLTIFFIIHYGLFCLGHGFFLYIIFILKEPINLNNLIIPIVLLSLSHFTSFISNFLLTKEYSKVDAQTLMATPYQRIWIIHLVIILGAFLIFGLNLSTGGIIVLVLLKTLLDLRAHISEHKNLEKRVENK